VARERLSNAIVSDYLRMIGGGEIAPGSSLPPESTLCETYGVGRSVVREALQALDAKGFIIVRQGSVAAVAPRYQWHVLDQEFLAVNSGEEFFALLQEAREVLEPQLAAVAAQRATPEALAEMESINDQLEAVKDSPERHAELDIAFHDALARATDNAILVSMHASITGLGHRTRAAASSVPGAIDRAVMWHRQIIEGVRAQDAPSASAAMLLHMRQVRGELIVIDTVRPADDGGRRR
jgi:DNA-binding FadR family transcriptional regulator